MGKSKELATTHDMVKQVLEQSKDARNSDNYLYYRILKMIGTEHGIDIEKMSVPHFFLHMKEYGCFPAFETVRRTRQKLQAMNPDLAADSDVEGYRILNEEVYRNYARGACVMWLIRLHIAISILCLITFIGFKSVCKETIRNNGWLSDKKKKNVFAWLVFFVPIMNILMVLILFLMIGMKQADSCG